MKIAAIAGMAMTALLASIPASAEVLTWDVRASAADGAVLSGSFQFSNGALDAQVLDFDLAISGGTHAATTAVEFDRSDSRSSIPFNGAVGFQRSTAGLSPKSYLLQIRTVSGAGFRSPGTVSISATEQVISGLQLRSEVFAGSATGIEEQSHVLPEPASSGMMAVGVTGALLLLMRRRLGGA